MSNVFNDTDSDLGLMQLYEDEIGANRGVISGNVAKKKYFTRDANLALDKYTEIAIKNSKLGWQWDDSNHTKYPIITIDITQDVRDYAFTTDEQGNLMLGIFKVLRKASSTGPYEEIFPRDVQSEYTTESFSDGLSVRAVSMEYEKAANGIFLRNLPPETIEDGMKIYINREASHFVYTDTTKMPGIPGTHHEYIAIRAARDYARRKSLKVWEKLELQVQEWEKDGGTIARHFATREADTRDIMSGHITSFM